jgi:WD40 repeat protein
VIASFALLLCASDLCVAGDALAIADARGLTVGERTLGAPRSILCLAADPTGRLLVEAGGLADDHGTLRLWDLAAGELAWERELHADLIYDVAWSPDGQTLYTASADDRIGVVPTDGSEPSFLLGHSDQVLCLAVAPDGTLASGSLDQTIRIWRDGTCVRSLDRHGGRVTSLAFSPDGTQLASGSADRTVRIWQHAIGRMRRILRDHDGIVLALVWDDQGLFSGASDGAVRALDPLRAEVTAVLWRQSDWIQSLARWRGELVAIDAAETLGRAE